MPILRKVILGTLLMTGLAACGGTATAGPVRLECQFDGARDEAAMCEAFRQQLATSLQSPVATAASGEASGKDGAWVSARFRVLPQGIIKGSVSYARGGQTGAIPDMNMAVSDRQIGPADAAAIAKQVAARIK